MMNYVRILMVNETQRLNRIDLWNWNWSLQYSDPTTYFSQIISMDFLNSVSSWKVRRQTFRVKPGARISMPGDLIFTISPPCPQISVTWTVLWYAPERWFYRFKTVEFKIIFSLEFFKLCWREIAIDHCTYEPFYILYASWSCKQS